MDFCALKESLVLISVPGVVDARIVQKPLDAEASLFGALPVIAAGVQGKL